MNCVIIICTALLCALLAIKRFYIVKNDYAKLHIQYWDRITSTLAIVVLLCAGHVYLPALYFKVCSLFLGFFVYLFATPIAATELTRWSETNTFDSNASYNLFFRGRFCLNAIKLYFTPIKSEHNGTQYYVINWLKGCGTILMTGVIPELFTMI